MFRSAEKGPAKIFMPAIIERWFSNQIVENLHNVFHPYDRRDASSPEISCINSKLGVEYVTYLDGSIGSYSRIAKSNCTPTLQVVSLSLD